MDSSLGELPEEIKWLIFSSLTDIDDILTISHYFRNFARITKGIENITTRTFKIVPLSSVSNFNDLKTIDHNVAIIIEKDSIDLLSSLPKLNQAYFIIYGSALMHKLLGILKNLNHDKYYFKIALILNQRSKKRIDLYDEIFGIFICNGKFMVIGNDKKYQLDNKHITHTGGRFIVVKDDDQEITYDLVNTIEKIWPGLVYVEPPLPPRMNILQWLGFFRKPMKSFLENADFGLLYSGQESADNIPLSSHANKYAVQIVNNRLTEEFIKLYMEYRGISIQEVILSYFRSQIGDILSINPEYMSIYQIPEEKLISTLIKLNTITHINIREISNIDFVDHMPELKLIDQLTDTISHIRYMRLTYKNT